MCRWLAYSGSPIRLEEFLVKPARSLVDQSLHSRMGATTTNGDGFGVGWYAEDGDGRPRTFHSIHPAWNDRNLREVAASINSPLFFAHIRASTGGAIQETNTHPFRHGRWLWMHNGAIREFDKSMHELRMAVDPTCSRRSRARPTARRMFYLALTFGLEDDPPAAVERMVGFVEQAGRARGVEHPIQMTVATTDGERIWAFRYSSEGQSRSLFYSTAHRPAAAAAPRGAGAGRALGRVPAGASRSRSVTCPAPGTRCRRRSGAVSSPARTRCTRSSREPRSWQTAKAMADTNSTGPLSGKTAWARNLETPLREFLRTETGSAGVLLLATVAALLWINVDASSYDDVWTTELAIRLGDHSISLDLRGWLNSGLMTLFFFVVGLEARREFDMGELRQRRRVALPVLAGLGGMAVPVLIYLAINAGHSSASGWGTAMSTDTAFALGMLALVGPRFPDRLRAFLLTVVIVDDVVALTVIALFYSDNVVAGPLMAALGVLAADPGDAAARPPRWPGVRGARRRRVAGRASSRGSIPSSSVW